MLANDRDVEGVAVLDEHPAGAIEDDAARRAQRQRALVVVLRHLLELGVLDDLEEPEAAGQQAEGDAQNDTCSTGEAWVEPASIFGNGHKLSDYRFKNRPARRLSTKPGSHSIIWNADHADEGVSERLADDRRVRRRETAAGRAACTAR